MPATKLLPHPASCLLFLLGPDPSPVWHWLKLTPFPHVLLPLIMWSVLVTIVCQALDVSALVELIAWMLRIQVSQCQDGGEEGKMGLWGTEREAINAT